VATTGLDGNPGTEAAPWRTLQYAVDNVAPGDEVVVHAGNYSGARIESSGTVSAYITLRTATGEAVILDTPAAGHKHDSILEVETWDSPGIVAYWVIDGFEIVGAGRSGVDLRLTHHIVVRDNQVHGSGLTGIFTAFSDDLLIEANESYANGEHGIYTSNSGDRPTIKDNLLHGNFAAGIHMNADVSQGGDGVISDALVERNIIFGNGLGVRIVNFAICSRFDG
jgi:parallel beta-helix repeat protein